MKLRHLPISLSFPAFVKKSPVSSSSPTMYAQPNPFLSRCVSRIEIFPFVTLATRRTCKTMKVNQLTLQYLDPSAQEVPKARLGLTRSFHESRAVVGTKNISNYEVRENHSKLLTREKELTW